MTRIVVEARVNPVVRLRTLATTAWAIATGIANATLGRVAPTATHGRDVRLSGLGIS